MMRFTQIIGSQHLLHKEVAAHSVRRRANHGDQMRIPLRGREHFLGFREIQSHPRLGEDMFAGFQSGNRDR